MLYTKKPSQSSVHPHLSRHTLKSAYDSYTPESGTPCVREFTHHLIREHLYSEILLLRGKLDTYGEALSRHLKEELSLLERVQERTCDTTAPAYPRYLSERDQRIKTLEEDLAATIDKKNLFSSLLNRIGERDDTLSDEAQSWMNDLSTATEDTVCRLLEEEDFEQKTLDATSFPPEGEWLDTELRWTSQQVRHYKTLMGQVRERLSQLSTLITELTRYFSED